MKRWTMDVAGMTCSSCERHVARAIEIAGGQDVIASWRDRTATFSAVAINEQTLNSAIADAGYQPGGVSEIAPVAPVESVIASTASQSNEDSTWDLAIIGSGSAAFAAAIRARDLGASVVMIERSTIGGTCVNVGCLPSKTLIRAGEIQHLAAYNDFAGLLTMAGPVDLGELVKQKDELVTDLRAGKYEDLLGEYGIDLIRGAATFTGPNTLTVGGHTINAGKYLVATGAAPAAPIPGLEETGYLTSTTALELNAVPASVAVIGANAIGLELGQFFSHVGADVTFFDALDRIAPFEEPEISDALTAVLRDQGTAIHCCARITRVERDGDKKVVVATVDGQPGETQVVVDEILVATGRRPNTAELGLDAAGVVASTCRSRGQAHLGGTS